MLDNATNLKLDEIQVNMQLHEPFAVDAEYVFLYEQVQTIVKALLESE